MESTMGLTCPKCRGAMSSYERSGIVIDQCSDCRGIFLDRGELERLLDLAAGDAPGVGTPSPATPSAPQPDPQWSGPAPDRSWRQAQPQQREWQGSRHDWDDDSDSDRRHRGPGGSYPQGGYPQGKKSKKKHSLLREFLDFG